MPSAALPAGFKEYASTLPGVDAPSFLRAMEDPPAVSIKLNRRKILSTTDIGYSGLRPVKWCASGFYLPERPQFTLNPLLHAGVFYVQDASSMIYETIVERLVESGDLKEGATIADFCAAPGGKTTSMINAVPDGVLVVANEYSGQRAGSLRENLLKWGYPEILVTNSPTRDLSSGAPLFDLVAVDAPCSGEGMMRKEEVARTQWSRTLVDHCAALQKEILRDAVGALKDGGVLVYSTCTFNLEENERQLAWLRDEFGLEPMDIPLPADWGVGGALEGDIPAMRFMPHLTEGEGLFAAVMRKPGTAEKGNQEKVKKVIRQRAKVIADGIPTSKSKGRVELPASESVLAVDYDRGKRPEAELDTAQALSYLRGEPLVLDSEVPKGFVAVTYKDHPLGLVKNIGTRANNLWPSPWKIRMRT